MADDSPPPAVAAPLHLGSDSRRASRLVLAAALAGLGLLAAPSSPLMFGATPDRPSAFALTLAPLEAEAVAALRQAFADAARAAGESAEAQAPPEPSTPFANQEPATADAAPPQESEPTLLARIVPLPVPRPAELRAGIGELARRAERLGPRRERTAAVPQATEDTRSFFDKLFGIERPATPGLAYAALETGPVAPAPRSASPFPGPVTGSGIAVYDISARIVTLPNGEKLEAHSGLGEAMDNPGHVHVRMKGPTPLGTYDIREREQPFHGVRALRLTPVGGPEAVHGRVGLLAHTYMLGPSGASNGCVSFRDYEKFLQAYLRGEVQRLVVVAGG